MNKDAVNLRNIPHVTITAFVIGAVFSIVSVLWTLRTTKEIPLDEEEKQRIRAVPGGVTNTLKEIVSAIREMPLTMRQLAWVKLFQWYAMFCYWQYIVLSISTTLFGTTDQTTTAFRDAGLINGQVGGFYNFVAFLAAFALVPVTQRIGPTRTHAFCLTLAGVGMWCIPLIHTKALLFLPMIGIGFAWASIRT
jgi:maltose/moltooligosaccharide transporter